MGAMEADKLVEEAATAVVVASPPTHAPTMGNLQKVNYSHVDMIDYLIANPGITQRDLSRRYGYTEGWFSNIMASDAFQSALAARRAGLVDPVLVATIKERFEGITHLSLVRLQQKLEAPQVSDNVVLKAAELGAKTMGLGGHSTAPPPPSGQDHLAALAMRLIDLQTQVRKGAVYENAEVVQPAS